MNLEDNGNLREMEFQVKQPGIYKKYIKRVFDFLTMMIFLPLFIPICVIISVAIKLDNPDGKVLFTQNRVGKNGEIFKIYKFRSMIVNAEKQLAVLKEHNEIDGAMFKLKKDPRITRVGSIIRKTSLDELPQFMNVIKGEMSIVGPRPSLPNEVLEYTEYDHQRFLVTPGITGLWQVSGRNTLSFNEMIELDLKYISDISILNDFKIVLKTLVVMLTGYGAY